MAEMGNTQLSGMSPTVMGGLPAVRGASGPWTEEKRLWARPQLPACTAARGTTADPNEIQLLTALRTAVFPVTGPVLSAPGTQGHVPEQGHQGRAPGTRGAWPVGGTPISTPRGTQTRNLADRMQDGDHSPPHHGGFFPSPSWSLSGQQRSYTKWQNPGSLCGFSISAETSVTPSPGKWVTHVQHCYWATTARTHAAPGPGLPTAEPDTDLLLTRHQDTQSEKMDAFPSVAWAWALTMALK